MSENKKPLVTVAVPAYNHEAWVEETILSIVNQTYGYENIQLIVTDDCSTDRTPYILNDLAEKYNFELILNKQNLGICLTINKMIERIAGKYYIGIASDDIMVLDRIERQVDILTQNPEIDILAGTSILIDSKGKEIGSKPQTYDDSLTAYSFEDIFLRLKPGFPAGSVIIKKELFDRIGAYDPNYKIEDLYFWLKAASNGANIKACRIPFLYYRLHNSSISSNSQLMDAEGVKILSIYKNHPKFKNALQTREIKNLMKIAVVSKLNVLKYLIKNPHLIIHPKAIVIFKILLLPDYLIKRKYIEFNYRFGEN